MKQTMEQIAFQKRVAIVTISVIGFVLFMATVIYVSGIGSEQQVRAPLPFKDQLLLRNELKEEIVGLSASKPRKSAEGFVITEIELLSSILARVHYNDGDTYYIADYNFRVEENELGIRSIGSYGFQIKARRKGGEPDLIEDALGTDSEPAQKDVDAIL